MVIITVLTKMKSYKQTERSECTNKKINEIPAVFWRKHFILDVKCKINLNLRVQDYAFDILTV